MLQSVYYVERSMVGATVQPQFACVSLALGECFALWFSLESKHSKQGVSSHKHP